MFQLETIVTNACNLNCTYCYINQTKTKSLTLKSFKQALNYLPEIRAELGKYNSFSKETEIAFFGGEPLLNMKVIKSITKYTPSFPHHVQTNGYLLPKYIQELDELNISYGISYDGPYANTRVNKTIDVFPLSLLETMKMRGVKCMLSPLNISSFSKNFEFFLEKGILYPDFSLVRDNIWQFGDILIFKQQLDIINEIIEKYVDKTGNVPIPGIYSLYLLDCIMGNTKGKRPFTCFSGTHGVSIQENGDIFPCARFASNNVFKLGNYKEQKINGSLIEKISSMFHPVYNKHCATCSIKLECNMGCNYSQLEYGNFKESKPINCICELYKICYEYASNFYLKYSKQVNHFLQHKLNQN